MSPRRRRTQSGSVLIVIALLAALWYAGMLPGVPKPNAVMPQIGTYIPDLKGFETFIPALPGATSQPGASLPSSSQGIGQRTKTDGCTSANAMPDHACTPGAIFPDATKEKICVSGYSSQVRNVPESEKDQVYAEYGIASHEPGQYEVDHLISLELGGSNDIANLWPEPAEPRPGFHEKDAVENYLHDQVCSGAISLGQAQSLIANDWLSVYNSMPK
ncbi:MAG TPA: HNH endonuclease signature motif containing protein [Anaerolineales bacterium]|nr:HNH endonuclease signature motif containing protein [Anaerolineales bacterium]